MNFQKSIFFKIFINFIAFTYVVFEEIFISFYSFVNHFIVKYNLFLSFNKYIISLHKYVILILFICLLAISEFLGLLSFIFLSKGNFLFFLFLYLFKFIPFFFVSYIFKLTKDSLLSISWFNFIFQKIYSFVSFLKQTSVFIKITSLKESFKFRKNSFKEKLLFLIKKHKQ